jgi:uncharacterized protein with HEPN domain
MSSRRSDIALVEDMLYRVRRIRRKTKGVKWKQFRDDEDLHDIVERSITIIGEAARKVSEEFREAHPEVPWVDTMNIRQKVVHDYFEVSYRVLWSTIKEDLPALEILLSNLVEE